MGRLVVLVTSPRLPAGLLTPPAWRAVEAADLVAATDLGHPLAEPLAAAAIEVTPLGDAAAVDLLALAADRSVVWLAGDDEHFGLTGELAEAVVRRADAPGEPGAVEVEVVMGSFDPIGARLLDAVAVMDRLRRDCPWDREQTSESLVPYLVEEAYEVIEAIEHGDLTHVREELGDLLFQVLFHARIAEEDAERGFGVDDVAGDLVDKLVRRHPHVFADTEVSGPDEVEANWEQIKRTEKGRESVVDGIPMSLPALSLAAKVVDRAVRGRSALSVPMPQDAVGYTEETLGEVLFALVAAARAGGLDAERALRLRVRREMDLLRAVPGNGEARG